MKHLLLPLPLLLLGTPVLAQDMPEGVARIVSAIGLEEVHWHPGREQADLDGKLGGTWIEMDFRRGGTLEEIEAHHDGLFDGALVEAILPEALTASPDFPKGAQFSKIDLKEDEFELEGRTAAGDRFEAKFDRHGKLQKWDAK